MEFILDGTSSCFSDYLVSTELSSEPGNSHGEVSYKSMPWSQSVCLIMGSLCIRGMHPKVCVKGTHTNTDGRLGMFRSHGGFFPRTENNLSWSTVLKTI